MILTYFSRNDLRSVLSIGALCLTQWRFSMKLLEQLAAACRTMNFSEATQDCYRHWVEDFLQFHRRRRHPHRCSNCWGITMSAPR